MKEYIAEKTISVSAEQAWIALSHMNEWLASLDSIKQIEYDHTRDFFVEGNTYNVLTPERVTMKTILYRIDQLNYRVELHAHSFLISSKLVCRIVRVDNKTCTIIRIQSYPGIIGKLFTTFFNRRESFETNQYLDTWESFANQ